MFVDSCYEWKKNELFQSSSMINTVKMSHVKVIYEISHVKFPM